MKRIMIAVMILAMIMLISSGCGIKDEKTQSNQAQNKEAIAQMIAMEEQNKAPKEMFDYLNQNISLMDKAAATEATGILVSVLEKYEAIYSEQLFTDSYPDLMHQYFETKFDYSRIDDIKEQELKVLLYDITLGGFRIIDTEGTFTVIVDYDALKTFNGYVDDELKSYIEIMAMSFNDPAAVDASIKMDSEELENRIMQIEAYIKGYENKTRKEIMISMYQGYMMVYMSGTDNTPVFDVDTGAIKPDMFKAFETAASKYKDAIFGKVMNKYVGLLKQESFTNTEKVNDFILNLDITVNDELAKVEKK